MNKEIGWEEEFISNYRPSHTYIFWDRPELESMMAKEFVSYVDSLRNGNKKEKHELELLLIRFIEAGKISDAIRIFTPEEIINVIENRKFFRLGKNKLRAWKRICLKSAESAGTKG